MSCQYKGHVNFFKLFKRHDQSLPTTIKKHQPRRFVITAQIVLLKEAFNGKSLNNFTQVLHLKTQRICRSSAGQYSWRMIVLEINVDLKDVRAGINSGRKRERNRSMMEKISYAREKKFMVRYRLRNLSSWAITHICTIVRAFVKLNITGNSKFLYVQRKKGV